MDDASKSNEKYSWDHDKNLGLDFAALTDFAA